MAHCECCGASGIELFKDWREKDDMLNQYIVCRKCLNRTNQSFWVKMSNYRKDEK